MLASQHNLHFMADFASKIRQAIQEDGFESFARAFLDRYTGMEEKEEAQE
jgi:tRNA-guanine family transglycosylase